jgi:hypothetical protein
MQFVSPLKIFLLFARSVHGCGWVMSTSTAMTFGAFTRATAIHGVVAFEKPDPSSTARKECLVVSRAVPFAFAIVLFATSAVLAGEPLAPSEIQTTFFTGQAFTATTPSGTKFKLTFTTDGKMTREPLAQRGNKSTGTWKLSAKGFCTTWSHSKSNCFTIVPSGENKWSVQAIATTIATTVAVWSK